MRGQPGSLLAVLLSASGASVLAPALVKAAEPAIYNLGTLGGPQSAGPGLSEGTAINDSGQVTGFSDTGSGPAMHAFRYTGIPGAGGVMQDLGSLGGPGSWGRAINDAGQVAGTVNAAGGSVLAFRHTGTPGTMTGLSGFGGNYSFGNGINAAGQITGNS